jgi:hypothetical protein
VSLTNLVLSRISCKTYFSSHILCATQFFVNYWALIGHRSLFLIHALTVAAPADNAAPLLTVEALMCVLAR